MHEVWLPPTKCAHKVIRIDFIKKLAFCFICGSPMSGPKLKVHRLKRD